MIFTLYHKARGRQVCSSFLITASATRFLLVGMQQCVSVEKQLEMASARCFAEASVESCGHVMRIKAQVIATPHDFERSGAVQKESSFRLETETP